jgi:hypothetical protein
MSVLQLLAITIIKVTKIARDKICNMFLVII